MLIRMSFRRANLKLDRMIVVEETFSARRLRDQLKRAFNFEFFPTPLTTSPRGYSGKQRSLLHGHGSNSSPTLTGVYMAARISFELIIR